MIDRHEVMDFAREFGLDPNMIEKDYVLGWLLAGITTHGALGPVWVFKGGTCLKKCFFETYRFSEDLDFTVLEKAQLDEEFLKNSFSEIARWVYDASGIELPQERLRFEVFENKRGGLSAEGRVGYRGPLQRGGDPSRIKLDFTLDEILVLDPVEREIHHPYTDKAASGFGVLCYSFEELFAEKIRALAERERPRDLYDVIHLYRHCDDSFDRASLLKTLKKKCEFKNIPVPTFAALDAQPERAELEAEWKNMLAHQLPVLPRFEQFWRELPGLFEWLHGAALAAPPSSLSVGPEIDPAWQPPAMAQAWHAPVPLEVVRFSAANRMCVDLQYKGSHRIIEPYSLRRTRDGNVLLYAVKHQTGEVRAYRVDRIQGATATNIPFVPKYAVELTPMGIAPPLFTAQQSRRSVSARPGLPKPRRSRPKMA